jgi:hypothetical protein
MRDCTREPRNRYTEWPDVHCSNLFVALLQGNPIQEVDIKDAVGYLVSINTSHSVFALPQMINLSNLGIESFFQQFDERLNRELWKVRLMFSFCTSRPHKQCCGLLIIACEMELCLQMLAL